MEIYFHKPAER